MAVGVAALWWTEWTEWTTRTGTGSEVRLCGDLGDAFLYDRVGVAVMGTEGRMVRAESLRKVFHPPQGGEVEAVCDATFSAGTGEVFGLLGPNGAGKTTLLRMLGTIIQPTSGYCTVDGIRTDDSSLEVRRRIGFLSGNTKLYGRLSGKEVLRYFGRLYGMREPAIDERIEELSSRLDMDDYADRRCDTLSTGQAQRVNVARVLLHDPPLLILDEPTLGLDILTSSTILDFILERRAQGCCVILSTHIMADAEMLCDRIALMHHGRLLAIGTKEALYGQTDTENLKDAFLAFVGTAPGRAS